jgi:16S rRNA (cytidine1402-2'-O)-methyltransferase
MIDPQPQPHESDGDDVDVDVVDDLDSALELEVAPIGGAIAPGTLALVATPIGNLSDLSPRAVHVLRTADAIACEDTRHTRKLLSAHSITGKRLLAVHEHNEEAASDGLVALLLKGAVIALVTDAGTPGISDPGERVVARVAKAGCSVICIPGPAAFVAALVVSGLSSERFVFEGFLPRTGAERSERLRELAGRTITTVLYEAPARIVKTMRELSAACGANRQVSVSRELTKRFETTWRGSAADAIVRFESEGETPRGEFVIVVGPNDDSQVVEHTDASLQELIAKAIADGLRVSEAVSFVVATTGVGKKRIYELAVAYESKRRNG